MFAENVIILNNENFESEVLSSDKAVLVDFWADWCGPCKAIMPIIDEIALEFSDKIKVCKLNVDETRDIAQSFGVMSIPTFIFFKNGEMVAQQVGQVGKPALISIINSL